MATGDQLDRRCLPQVLCFRLGSSERLLKWPCTPSTPAPALPLPCRHPYDPPPSKSPCVPRAPRCLPHLEVASGVTNRDFPALMSRCDEPFAIVPKPLPIRIAAGEVPMMGVGIGAPRVVGREKKKNAHWHPQGLPNPRFTGVCRQQSAQLAIATDADPSMPSNLWRVGRGGVACRLSSRWAQLLQTRRS